MATAYASLDITELQVIERNFAKLSDSTWLSFITQ